MSEKIVEKISWHGKDLKVEIDKAPIIHPNALTLVLSLELEGQTFNSKCYYNSELNSKQDMINLCLRNLEESIKKHALGLSVEKHLRLLEESRKKQKSAQWLVKQFNL